MPEPANRPDPGGDEEPIVDLMHLTSFTDGDPQLEGELAALYVANAELYLERMARALEAGESWSAPAHALKGASSNLGARRVAGLARAAEHGAPDRAQLRALDRALAEVRSFFAARRVS